MGRLLAILATTRPATADLGLLVLRLSVGLSLALAHGFDKWKDLDGLRLGLEAQGIPLPQVMAWLLAAAETGGGLLVAAGLCTRPAALSVVIAMSVAFFHTHAGDPFATQELAFMYGTGYLAVLLAGPGRIAFDAIYARRNRGAQASPQGTLTSGD